MIVLRNSRTQDGKVVEGERKLCNSDGVEVMVVWLDRESGLINWDDGMPFLFGQGTRNQASRRIGADLIGVIGNEEMGCLYKTPETRSALFA